MGEELALRARGILDEKRVKLVDMELQSIKSVGNLPNIYPKKYIIVLFQCIYKLPDY